MVLEIYLNRALCCNDTVHRSLGEGIELFILPPHEVWFEEVAAITIVLKLALTQTFIIPVLSSTD